MKIRKSLAFFHPVAYNIDIKKAPTPKVDASLNEFSALTDTAHPVCRQDGHFYFRLFLLSRKAINAIMSPAKDMSKPSIPMITITVSYAVICTTSFPYVLLASQSKGWRHTTPVMSAFL